LMFFGRSEGEGRGGESGFQTGPMLSSPGQLLADTWQVKILPFFFLKKKNHNS
jgi:hypothetical protein